MEIVPIKLPHEVFDEWMNLPSEAQVVGIRENKVGVYEILIAVEGALKEKEPFECTSDKVDQIGNYIRNSMEKDEE